jgi:hypothetical protein
MLPGSRHVWGNSLAIREPGRGPKTSFRAWAREMGGAKEVGRAMIEGIEHGTAGSDPFPFPFLQVCFRHATETTN